MTSTPMAVAITMLCRRVKRKSLAWSATVMAVAAAATAMFCTLIILPTTPPAELAAAMSVGSNPKRPAVTTCRLPKRAFAEVSEPVRKTPSQPSKGLKKGKSLPDAENANPRVAVAPQ